MIFLSGTSTEEQRTRNQPIAAQNARNGDQTILTAPERCCLNELMWHQAGAMQADKQTHEKPRTLERQHLANSRDVCKSEKQNYFLLNTLTNFYKAKSNPIKSFLVPWSRTDT